MILIAHNELGHEPEERIDATGKKRGGMCPLYPGMTCMEHCDAAVEIDTTRDENLIQVPFIELCPNSWLVPPDGTPEQIPEADQFVAKKVMAAVEAMQKKLGDSLPRKAFDQIHNALTQAEAAIEEEAYGKALRAYAGIETLARKPPTSLKKMLDVRMAELDEEVRYVFDDAVEPGPKDESPLAERVKKVQDLLKTVDIAVFGKKLPLVADMQAWLKKNAAK